MIDSHYAYEYVYEQILKELREKGRENVDVLPSEKEYCIQFGVSLTTVRRALARLYQERIIVKIKGKGSVVSENVRKFLLTPNQFIGVLMVPFYDPQSEHYEPRYNYANPYAQIIYKTIYRELNKDYDILIDTIDSKDLATKFPYSVLSKADKILVLGEVSKEVLDYLHSMGKCVLVYNYFEKGVKVARVNNDERKQFCAVANLFIHQGRKNLACINGADFYSEAIERYLGIQDAMIENDIYFNNMAIKWGNMTPESGYYLMKDLLQLRPRIDGVICVNDGVMMGAIDAIKEAGLNIHNDIKVAGHDNIEIPGISQDFVTIDPDFVGVGKVMADLFRRDTWIDEEILHPASVIVR